MDKIQEELLVNAINVADRFVTAVERIAEVLDGMDDTFRSAGRDLVGSYANPKPTGFEALCMSLNGSPLNEESISKSIAVGLAEIASAIEAKQFGREEL